MPAPASDPSPGQPVRLFLASSNAGKLNEFRALAADTIPAVHSAVRIDLELLPNFSAITPFEEAAPTFAENAAGKALYYSRFAALPVLADDSGLVVDALGGEPGVYSARYAGPHASSADCMAKLLAQIKARASKDRRARFICVLALARAGRMIAVFSGAVEGEILPAPRGEDGFGYDPIFFFGPAGKSFAEISPAEKNRYSHRAKAFRSFTEFLASSPVL